MNLDCCMTACLIWESLTLEDARVNRNLTGKSGIKFPDRYCHPEMSTELLHFVFTFTVLFFLSCMKKFLGPIFKVVLEVRKTSIGIVSSFQKYTSPNKHLSPTSPEIF